MLDKHTLFLKNILITIISFFKHIHFDAYLYLTFENNV